MIINISEDFSNTPGSRYISEGAYSGEEFRDNLLIQQYDSAIANGEKLEINFNGCYGFATSFLEESFGGLVRKYKKSANEILDTLVLISDDDASIPELIRKYVTEAERIVNV